MRARGGRRIIPSPRRPSRDGRSREAGERQRMTSRREFLEIGIAASTWPLATHAARAAGLGEISSAELRREPVPLYKVIYDTRFPQSVAFGRRAAALGVDAHAIEGDMTRLWFDDVYHRWKQAPAAIAGLTAHGPLFCFERLAWEQGLRVVFRAEHGCDAAGALARTDWSAAMAEVVTQCPSGKAELDSIEIASPGAAGTLATEPLYSWVI